MLTPRQKTLLDYFLDVTRDLVHRGTLRRSAGQSFVDILKKEPHVVLTEVKNDVAVVLKELGVGLLGGLEVIARKQAENFISFGAEVLAGALRKR